MITIKPLSVNHIDKIVELTKQLNPDKSLELIKERQMDMFTYDNHTCFGCYLIDELVGVISGWITVRLYSGKQLEIDNVIIDHTKQSMGLGNEAMIQIEQWAKNNNCLSIELNTYVHNSRSHKFYFNQGYQILGYHFVKKIKP